MKHRKCFAVHAVVRRSINHANSSAHHNQQEPGGSRTLSSHCRPGVLVRVLRLRRSPEVAVPTPHQPGIELVDGRTRVVHRVSSEALFAGRLAGDYRALCGAWLLAASLTDPGRDRCRECAS